MDIIVIDKPHGITSMDVVRRLRKILKPVGITKIGYAGTLDPFATGVLVVGIGRGGTRQLGELTDQDKEYICEIDLLKNSVSGDMQNFDPDTDQMELKSANIPTFEEINTLIQTKFTGSITQIPSAYSAIKINGKRAYELVRDNQDVDMKSRNITIYEIEILEYNFPVLKLRVKCSKGTYIRTLGQDIGKELGLWGTLISLRRTKSGEYSLENAKNLDALTIDDIINNK